MMQTLCSRPSPSRPRTCWSVTPWGDHVVRLFTARHPERVAGLLLVDPQHERRADFGQELSPRWADPLRQPDLHVPGYAERFDLAGVQREMDAVHLPPALPVRLISRGLPDRA